MSEERPQGVETALDRIAGEIERVFDSIRPLGAEFAAVASGATAPGRDDLMALRETIDGILAAHRGLVAGAGVVVAPGLLADAPYWLEWWWARPAKLPELLRVNLSPAAPDFFDYTTADWFVTPETTGRPHVAGPYVDYVCSNEYALTIALPVFVEGRFIGVAGADVTISGLENRVLPELLALSPTATLVTAAGRVVASASPDLAPGQRLDPVADGGAESTAWDWRIVDA